MASWQLECGKHDADSKLDPGFGFTHRISPESTSFDVTALIHACYHMRKPDITPHTHTPTKGRPDLQIEACLHDTVEMHVPESPERIFAGANQAATFTFYRTWKTIKLHQKSNQSKALCSNHWLESASLQN